jgi:hypothetical protein
VEPTDDDRPGDDTDELPVCPDCGAVLGGDPHRCTPEPQPADEADDPADLFTDLGEAGA